MSQGLALGLTVGFRLLDMGLNWYERRQAKGKVTPAQSAAITKRAMAADARLSRIARAAGGGEP